jgi:hypothetical protein
MADLATLGAVVSLALSMGAEATLKSTVGEVVKDGYKALKEKVSHWAAHDVEALEKTPTSTTRQAVIAEIIDAQSQEDRDAVYSLAETLSARLKENASTVGLDIGRLTALEVALGNINVTEGIGVRMAEAHVQGTFRTADITVGPPLGKP